MLGCTLLGPGTLFHHFLVLWWIYCTFWPVFLVAIVFLTLLNGLCSVCVLHLVAPGIALVLSWSVKFPFKHHISVNTSLNLLCILSVVLVFAAYQFLCLHLQWSSLFSDQFCCYYRGYLCGYFLFRLILFCFVLICHSCVDYLLSGSSQSVAIAIHSLASPLLLVHFLVLQRNCINTWCPF